MRILLINPPYVTLTASFGVGHQIPFGLLAVAGPLIDAGHEVALLDAEVHHPRGRALAARIAAHGPDVVMTGHSGSTPAHPVCLETLRLAKEAAPQAVTVYGGVYPTYHAADILNEAPWIDVIVRGEGEATAAALAGALSRQGDLADVKGLAFRRNGTVHLGDDSETIKDLNSFRIAWELIENWDLYQCFGMGRAAIVQFSRGCPHVCSYCGQYGFWRKWRHRDPIKLADEIAWLHHTHGVNFIDLADENPTSSKRLWKQFLSELAARKLPVRLFATIRATDIVRDADILPLYKQAGMMCVLMGIETTDPDTLASIRKGSTVRADSEAVRLLREAGILSMFGHIVGFEDETFETYRRAVRQIMAYDPDLLNAMYVTPHRWTDWAAQNGERGVIQADREKWDYRHQLLSCRKMAPWRIFALVKLTELIVHARPRALARLLFHPDPELRRHLRWCFNRSARVWFAEIAEFLFKTRFVAKPKTLKDWFGGSPATSSVKGD